MSKLAKAAMMGAAGAAGDKLYVEDVFSTYLYTGNDSTQTITNGIDLSGEGGLVWIKQRNGTYAHVLTDTERGAGQVLVTNSTSGSSGTYGISSFDSDGFALDSTVTFNSSSNTFASWTFRKAEKFFDVVTYTGNGSNRTIAHNLGSVPGCIIVKRTDSAESWVVYHQNLASPESDFILLNSISASDTTTYNRWGTSGNVSITSAHFSVGTADSTNVSGGTFVAYLFAHDAGGFGDDGTESVIKCGGTTLDASGFATVSLGYEPQFVMIKSAEYQGDWAIYDTTRGAEALKSSNLYSAFSAKKLQPNSASSESTATDYTIAPSSTGFTLSATGYAGAAFDDFIYIAIRRGPMKTPEDATTVFDVDATRSAAPLPYDAGFPVDLFIQGTKSSNSQKAFALTRLTGIKALVTNTTAAEVDSGFNFDSSTGVTSSGAGASSDHVGWMFRRAPGFLDVVAYTGTGGGSRTVPHNLGVAPELMIVKRRDLSGTWKTYVESLGATKHLNLNFDSSFSTSTFEWNDTAPTSSVFTVGTNNNTSSGLYIAYLFATVSGVSKVGSYTGTGTTLDIDCGFTAGARFVLIKRTDDTGDWYVWDTARGIVSGNDPYLLLNSTAAEVTNTDYIDPLSSGFQISSTAPVAINADGGSYIFLAIA